MMKVPDSMQRVVDGIRYRVAAATLLADDQYWDGHNYERRGRGMPTAGRRGLTLQKYIYVRLSDL